MASDIYIVEKSSHNLNVNKKDNTYVLEGVFAVFGKENNNNRVYEEEEYLPHLDYLNEKIKQKRLLGELDHPEKFDVSLNNISHIIEHLEYDKATRTLNGRIRILDTPKGQIAKTLVDSGIPLSISSRAAGAVSENKTVKIKKIFTYDLVMDPGFTEARLNQVSEGVLNEAYSSYNDTFEMINESLLDGKWGVSLNDLNLSTGITDKLEMINESLGLDNDEIKIYDASSMEDDFMQALIEGKNIEEEMNKNYVTIEALDNYSIKLGKQIKQLEEKLGELKEANSSSDTDSDTDSNEVQTLKEKVEVLESYLQVVAENCDKNITYSKATGSKVNETIEQINNINESVTKSVSYIKEMSTKINETIDTVNSVDERSEHNINYVKMLAKETDKVIEFTKYLSENLDKTISFSEYLSEELDSTILHSDHIVKEFQKFEGKKVEEEKDEEEEKEETVEENNKQQEEKLDEAFTFLPSKIDKILESVNKKNTELLIAEKKYDFFSTLSPESQKTFLSLEETKKQKVANKLSESSWYTENDVIALWQNVIQESESSDKWISEMPEKYTKIWENLSEAEQMNIVKLSKFRKLDSEYQIRHFWDSINFGQKAVGLQTLNENETPISKEQKTHVIEKQSLKMGYTQNYKEGIKNQLKGRFNK